MATHDRSEISGKGLGKMTLEVVINFIKTYPFGLAAQVWLSYEPENTHAIELYHKFGFVENGEMCGSETVAVYNL